MTGTVAAMERADRRVRGVTLLLVAAFAVVAASMTASDGPGTRNEAVVLGDLVHRALRADAHDWVVRVRNRRVDGTRTNIATSTELWLAGNRWSLRRSGDLAFVATPDRGFVCRTAQPPICTGADRSRSTKGSSADAYLAAVTSGRYRIRDSGSRTIVGAPARCFRLDVVDVRAVIAGLGTRLDVCLRADGVVVASTRRQGSIVDTVEATDVRTHATTAERRQLEAFVAAGSALPVGPGT